MGMGVGGYGIQFFDEPLSGTHNLFLDTWMESGLLGLSLFVFLLVLMALHSATAQTFFGGDRLPAIATGVMFLLMIREHSPAYLGVTSMGGVCFALIFCVLARPLRSTRISQSGISTPVRRPMGRLRQNPSRVKLINT
jgi:O-antigen ligase